MVVTLGGDTLSLFTLSGAASWITLEVGAGIGIGCTMGNISTKQHSTAVCSVTIVLYGAAGAGFYRARMRYCADWEVSSADYMRGIGNLCGKIPQCH